MPVDDGRRRPFRDRWDPLPGRGVVGVVGRVLVQEDDFFVAQLRFSEHATIAPTPAARHDRRVRRRLGVHVGGQRDRSAREGQQVRWREGSRTGLWTEGLDDDDPHGRALRLSQAAGSSRGRDRSALGEARIRSAGLPSRPRRLLRAGARSLDRVHEAAPLPPSACAESTHARCLRRRRRASVQAGQWTKSHLLQWALLPLDDEEALACEDEEVSCASRGGTCSSCPAGDPDVERRGPESAVLASNTVYRPSSFESNMRRRRRIEGDTAVSGR